ncbi:MAG: hypothetical protein HC779_00270 [Phyllobacteriaceae bacterium]|nr:hypothetical protein [Phyllobacteriaceae bacterium]
MVTQGRAQSSLAAMTKRTGTFWKISPLIQIGRTFCTNFNTVCAILPKMEHVMSEIQPTQAVLYSQGAIQLPKIDLEFDRVVADAARNLVMLTNGSAQIAASLPKSGVAVPKTGESGAAGDSVPKIIYQLQAAYFSQAVVGVVGNVGQTIKTLLRGG